MTTGNHRPCGRYWSLTLLSNLYSCGQLKAAFVVHSIQCFSQRRSIGSFELWVGSSVDGEPACELGHELFRRNLGLRSDPGLNDGQSINAPFRHRALRPPPSLRFPASNLVPKPCLGEGQTYFGSTDLRCLMDEGVYVVALLTCRADHYLKGVDDTCQDVSYCFGLMVAIRLIGRCSFALHHGMTCPSHLAEFLHPVVRTGKRDGQDVEFEGQAFCTPSQRLDQTVEGIEPVLFLQSVDTLSFAQRDLTSKDVQQVGAGVSVLPDRHPRFPVVTAQTPTPSANSVNSPPDRRPHPVPQDGKPVPAFS